jgi:hypothetical protein
MIWAEITSSIGGATEVSHVGDQVLGMFDDGGQFMVVYVPAVYGCPQAGKQNFILGTSAEVAGLTSSTARTNEFSPPMAEQYLLSETSGMFARRKPSLSLVAMHIHLASVIHH